MTQISIHYTGDIVTKKEAIELSLTRYFTGKPCPNNHIAQRNTKRDRCYECARVANKKYESKNKEKLAITDRKYYEKNKNNILNTHKKWKNANKEKIKLYLLMRKTYDKKFNERNKERSLRYWNSHKEKLSKINKEWREKNKDKASQYKNNRRARISGNGGTHTAKQAKELLEFQNYKCVNCKCCLKKNIKHFDHIIPIKLGGTSDIKNMQWLCQKCNTSKHAKHPIDWAQENGRLL